MACSSCGRENRPDSRFCSGCGTPLAVSCAACERELAPDARFCDGCGAPVASGGTAPGDPAEAVRKTVTAVFCDLVGSTAFGERVDAESAREAMGRYHAMAQSVIDDHGGTVAKFIGDGVMALFGVPEVGPDDAERAVRAGLALQAGFGDICDHIADRHGVEVGLRVGINTGEVVIADDDADVVGDALNTAARLEAACVPGRVLVGESTYRLTRAAAEFAPQGEIEARGKDEPVAAFEVVAALVEGGETDELATPFVGRDDELRRLRLVLEDSILQRRAALVSVVGSPGVGKTRLAREMRAAVEGGSRAFELRCERSGTATFAPIAELLRNVAGITDAHSVDEMTGRVRGVVADLDDAERVADLLCGFVGAAPMRSTEEMFLAVRRLFEVLGATQPVVLVVDDIQWAEPLLLDLLEHLAEWVQTVPLLVVCLARPEIREVRPVLAEQGRRVAEVVNLEGLSVDATAELAARLVGADALPAELLARIPESTEGNPLFVRELMRMLVDDGVISDASGRWEMVIDVEAVEVPPTINSLLASRVERMSPDERRVLELAAVVGSEFPIGAVEAAGEQSRRALEDAFERLRRKELIEPTGSYWGDEPVYRFHHVLIRDAAYRRLLKGARVELHTAVGEWTERTAAALVGEHEVTIAHHFEQAHRYRWDLDLDDTETKALGERAARLFHVAAERALEREDLAAAGSLAQRALGCVGDDDEEIAELLLLGCEAVLGVGNVGDGAPLVDRLAAVAADDERLGAWVDAFRVQVSVFTDPAGLSDAARAADRAAETLAALDDRAGVAKARLQRAACLVRLGQVGDCETELDLALSAARAVDDRRRVTAVLGAAPIAALWGPSPVPRAGGRCLDVVRLLRITTGSPSVEATSIRCQAVLEGLRGRYDTARSMLENARSTVEELGLDHDLMETEYYTGLVELLAGDPAAAEPHLRRAHEGLGRLGIGADAGQAAAHLARALLLQDRLDEAEELALESEAVAGQNPQTAIISRSVHAEILSARGRHDAALALADEAVASAAGTDILVDHANAVATQARVRAAAGDAGGAAAAAESARDLYEQKGATITVDAAATVPSPASPASGADAPWNTADRLTRRLMQAGVPREAWFEAIADDVVFDDRRSLVAGRYEGVEAVVEGFLDGIRALGDFELATETIAARGDDFVLFRGSLGSDVTLVSWLSVGDWRGGKLRRAVLFDGDDDEAAIAELDRMAAAEPAPADEWGPAYAALARSHHYMWEGQVDEWEAMLADDFVWDDRRSMVGHETVGREAGRTRHVTAAGRAAPRSNMSIEPVAVRGDQLALAYVHHGSEATYEGDYLLLARLPRPDLGDLVVVFDGDDYDAALTELDRLYAEELEPIAAFRVELVCRARQAWRDADTAFYDAYLLPGCELHDQQPLGAGAVPAASVVDDFMVHDNERLRFPDRLFAVEGRGLHGTFRSSSRVGGGDATWHERVVQHVDAATGLVAALWMFPVDDARAALHAWNDPPPTSPAPNRATWVGGAVNAAVRTGLTEALPTLTVDPERVLSARPSPFGGAGRRVIAVRGARLALIEVLDDDDGDRHWSVEEADEDGRLSDWTVFAARELKPALDHLDDRARALAEVPWTVASEYAVRHRDLDVDGVDRLLADDFSYVDHRPLGWGTLDRVTFLTASLGLGDTGDPGIVVVTALAHHSDRGTAGPMLVLHRDTGAAVETTHGVLVLATRDEQIFAMELFGEDDEERALARFDDLTAPAGATTWAERCLRTSLELLRNGDLDGLAETYHDDLRWDGRRSGFEAQMGKRQAIENAEFLVAAAKAGARFEQVPFATRGARLVVAGTRTVHDDFVVQFPMAMGFDLDGRIRRVVAVDTEAEALAVLDELQAEEDLSFDLVNTATMAFDRDRRSDTPATVVAVRADDVALYDLGEVAGPELLLIRTDVTGEIVREERFALGEQTAALLMLEEWNVDSLGDHAPAAHETLARFVSAYRIPDAAAIREVVSPELQMINHGALGQVASFDEADDVVAAIVEMAQAVDSLVEKVHRHSDEAVLVTLAGSVRMDDGERWGTRQLVVAAVRDERIALVEMWDHDDITAALARYEELAGADTGPPLTIAERGVRAFYRAAASGSDDVMAATLADGFVHEDRRLLMRSTVGKAATVASRESLAAVSSRTIATRGARLVATASRTGVEGGTLIEWIDVDRTDVDARLVHSITVETEADAAGVLDELVEAEERSLDLVNTATMLFGRDATEPFEVVAVRQDLTAVVAVGGAPTYVQLESDVAGNLTTTDAPDLESALDWLDERSSELIGAPPEVRLLLDFRHATTAGDRAGLEATIASDFTSRIHTSLSFGTFSREEYVELSAETGGQRTVVPKVLAFTDHLWLTFHRTTDSATGAESAGLILIDVDDGGVHRIELWNPGDLAAALARFDELAGERLWNRAADVQSAALRAAFVHGALDPERFHPDYVLDDRRKLARLRSDGREEVIDAFSEVGVFDHLEYDVVAVHGDHVVLCRALLTADDPALEVEVLGVAEIDDEGRQVKGTMFDPDQLDEARAVFDEMVEASRQAVAPSNTATELFAVGMELINRGDLSGVEGAGDDFEYHNNVRMPDPDGSGAAYAATIASYARDGWTWTGVPVAVAGDRFAVLRLRVTAPDGDDHRDMVVSIALGEDPDDGVVALAAFEPEDLRRAFVDCRRRWLEAESSRLPGPVVAAFEVEMLTNEPERGEFGSVVVDGFAFRDHRPGSVMDGLDRGEWIAAQEALFVDRPQLAQWGRILRIESDVFLSEAHRWSDPAVAEPDWSWLQVSIWDGSGLARLEVFDRSQRAEAETRFEQLAAGSGG